MLTAMDFASRFPEAVPMKKVDTEAVVEAFIQVFTRYGISQEILTDNGEVFTSKWTQALFRTLDIASIRTSPCHPQSNGMVERFYRTLKTVISKLEDPSQWAAALPMALFAARDAPHAATGCSPFQLLFGHSVNGPTAALHRIWTGNKKTPVKVSQYLQTLKRRMSEAVKVANTRERTAKESAKDTYDRGTVTDELEEGDEVLLLHPAVESGWKAAGRACTRSNKRSPR